MKLKYRLLIEILEKVNLVKRYRYARFKEVYKFKNFNFFVSILLIYYTINISVPGIVEQIEWHWINNYTVRITWVEPINLNGVIMGYYVLYTSELHVPPTSWQQLNVSQHKHSLDVRKILKEFILKSIFNYFILYCS